MAKTFYNLEEAAAKLGMSQEHVKELAQQNKIQQFRNGDKLMFKVEQIDNYAAGGKDDSGPIALADTGAHDAIKLSDESPSDRGDAINLAEDTDVADAPLAGKSAAGKTGAGKKAEDPKQATGVSVFDADEIEPADPKAQTQVTMSNSPDEELALESIGSGSGLLDLTRESDDTSLGAELLDEIYPGGGEGSDAKVDSGATGTSEATVSGGATQSAGGSGVFDGAIQMEGGSSGLEHLQSSQESGGTMLNVPVVEEASDPAGSLMGAGMLFGVSITLFIGLVIATAAISDARTPIVQNYSSMNGVGMLCGGLLVLSLILGGVGFAVGNVAAKRASA